MPNTATKEDVDKDLTDMSTRISTLVRANAVAIIAIGSGLILTPSARVDVWPLGMLAAMALALIALLLEWAQYLAGYMNSLRTWQTMEKDDTVRGWTPDWLYDSRAYMFYAKQAAAAASVVVLIGAMLPAIIRLVTQP